MPGGKLTKLARIITGYSTSTSRGDRVLIECSGERSFPLVREIYRQCLERGAAVVEYDYVLPRLTRDFYDLATPDQIRSFPEHRLDTLKKFDVVIGIRAEENTMELASVPREKIASRTRVLGPLLEWRVNHTRWLVTRVPTYAMAQETGCSLEEMEDLFFNACLHDWEEESKKQDSLIDVLQAGKTIRIVGKDTDLELDISGAPLVKADGHRNLPDGEVFTAPAKASAHGKIRFNCPSYYGGTRFEGIRLEFDRGKVISAQADTGEEDLDALLNVDDGASYIGEFAFGLNHGVTRPVGIILFDEKISGSIHLALGNAYKSCSNGNRSAIHWDLVRLMNDGGEVHLDGECIQKNGLFTIPKLAHLNPGT